MSEARPSTSTPTVLRVILGRRLQDIRLDAAGASLEDAARALRVKTLTIRRLEKAEVALRPLYVKKLPETSGEFRSRAASSCGCAARTLLDGRSAEAESLARGHAAVRQSSGRARQKLICAPEESPRSSAGSRRAGPMP